MTCIVLYNLLPSPAYGEIKNKYGVYRNSGLFSECRYSAYFFTAGNKTWKEKSAKDISLLMFIIAAVNEMMWIWYGVLLDNWVIILTNSIVLAMSSTMICLKLIYNR
jgi:Sugar efflux transporter for intercellular exchange